MAKAKDAKPAKAKGKGGGGGGNLLGMLLKNSKYLAIGVGGVGLAACLGSGVMSMLEAKSPADLANGVDSQLKRIDAGVRGTDGEKPDDLPAWVDKSKKIPDVPAERFALTFPFFNPVKNPDAKRENPAVYGIDEVQVDLVRAAMRGYDIGPDANGEPQIAVLSTRTIGTANKTQTLKALNDIQADPRRRVKPQAPPRPGFPGAAPAGGPPPGTDGAYGVASAGGFDTGGRRSEEATIAYIPLKDLVKSNKFPAMTVIPLRMVVIHATYPLKRQLEEMKRALRMPSVAETAKYGPRFDGYEVKRKVYGANGKVIQDWADYKYEDQYDERIDAVKLADHPDDPYLRSYFLRYEDALALPLPELVPVNGTSPYPDVKLKAVTETIQKLIAGNKAPELQSEFQKRLLGGGGKARFSPKTADATGAAALYGSGTFSGSYRDAPPPPPPVPGAPVPPGGKPGDPLVPPAEQEHLLIRFIDPDVRPGLTYEYQIRVRMKNPNYKQTEYVSNPQSANEEILYGPWVQIAQRQEVPAESFLYAFDTAQYQTRAAQVAGTDDPLKKALTARDGPAPAETGVGPDRPRQAAIQIQQWTEQVRTEGGRREPVGAWVVGEMPVTRGEYVGRKQFLKLPLWSSEAGTPPAAGGTAAAATAAKDAVGSAGRFVLREVAAAALGRPAAAKSKDPLPRGWVVDFSTKSILVDFEGGKVRQSVGGRTVSDEAGTELLIVRPDGKLIVRSSEADKADPEREVRTAGWDAWVAEVERGGGGGGAATVKPGDFISGPKRN